MPRPGAAQDAGSAHWRPRGGAAQAGLPGQAAAWSRVCGPRGRASGALAAHTRPGRPRRRPEWYQAVASTILLPLAVARRLALRCQLLAGPRPKPTREGILEVVERIGCLQIDPTNVVARNQLLVLFSRLGSFDPALLDRLAYDEHRLFEYWAHQASFVLADDYPLHRLQMRGAPHPRVGG